MNIDKIDREIAVLQVTEEETKEVLAAVMQNIKDREQAIAEHMCPFEVGERVINPDGKEEEIARISYSCYEASRYSFSVRKIKLNGDTYVNASYAWRLDKYTKKEGS